MIISDTDLALYSSPNTFKHWIASSRGQSISNKCLCWSCTYTNHANLLLWLLSVTNDRYNTRLYSYKISFLSIRSASYLSIRNIRVAYLYSLECFRITLSHWTSSYASKIGCNLCNLPYKLSNDLLFLKSKQRYYSSTDICDYWSHFNLPKYTCFITLLYTVNFDFKSSVTH